MSHSPGRSYSPMRASGLTSGLASTGQQHDVFGSFVVWNVILLNQTPQYWVCRFRNWFLGPTAKLEHVTERFASLWTDLEQEKTVRWTWQGRARKSNRVCCYLNGRLVCIRSDSLVSDLRTGDFRRVPNSSCSTRLWIDWRRV